MYIPVYTISNFNQFKLWVATARHNLKWFKNLKYNLRFNPYPYFNFHPLEVVSHHRDPQLQVVENYAYLFDLRPNMYKSWYLNSHFIHNNSDLIG